LKGNIKLRATGETQMDPISWWLLRSNARAATGFNQNSNDKLCEGEHFSYGRYSLADPWELEPGPGM